MGLVDFQIMFEKPLPTYFPGEVVNGQLVVNLSSEKKMAKIKVRPHLIMMAINCHHRFDTYRFILKKLYVFIYALSL